MISSFERGEHAPAGMALGDAGYDTGKVCIALFRQPHTRQWIILVRVEAGGDDHEFRLERVGRRHQRFLKDCAILLIALTRLHRHIDCEPFPCSPSSFRLSTRSRIMRIWVRAEEEHGGIVLETMLRAVPMMHIPIDNQHTFEAMLLLHIARSDRHIVEETEAHRTPRFGMMPR